jgi:peroxin-5
MSKPGPSGTSDLSEAFFRKGRLGIGSQQPPFQQQSQTPIQGERNEFEFEEYLNVSSSNEMNSIHSNRGMAREFVEKGPLNVPLDMARNWKNEFMIENHKGIEFHGTSSNWKGEFFAAGPSNTARAPVQWMEEFHQQHGRQGLPPQEQWNEEFERVYASNQHDTLDFPAHSKGKQIASMTEVDWIREFEEMKLAAEIGIPRSTPWSQEFNDAEANTKISGPGNQSEEWQTQFEELWQKMKVSETPGNHDWAKEFKDILPDTFPTSLLNQNDFDYENKRKDIHEADPVLADCALYTFEPVNPYLEHPNPFQAGLDIINSPSGSLTSACLAFEAAVQRDSSNDEAWQRLGMTQAENEKEVPAIAALQRCVQENPKNLEALMV